MISLIHWFKIFTSFVFSDIKDSHFSSHNWNTLFLGANAVADVMAEKYGTTKSDILDAVSGHGDELSNYEASLLNIVHTLDTTRLPKCPSILNEVNTVRCCSTVDSRYLAPVRSQNSRVRVKWFSRYLALSREGPNSRLAGSQSHILTSVPLKPKQYVER